jgi:hypothetical protein
MTRQQAEKLLGGYATGTLTDEEKSALFSAALEHQELFDALADEEALRELLADPAARHRLLNGLPERRRPRRFWQPIYIGLAASLAGAAILGVGLLWNSSTPKPVKRITTLIPTPAVPEPPSPSAEIVPAQPPGPIQKTKPPAPRTRPAKTVSDRSDLEQEIKAAAESSPQAATFSQNAKLRQAAPAPDAIGVIGGVPPVSIGALTLTSEPGHTLQLLDDGRARVTVNSPSGGNVYLVKRSADTGIVIRSLRSVSGPSGTTRADFEFPLSPSDSVDLYILPKPVPNPAGLPIGNIPNGYYRRIYPPPQTIQPKP